MMNFDKKTKIGIGIVAVVVVIVLILILVITRKPDSSPIVTTPDGGGNQSGQSTVPVTREAVPPNVVVPDMNSQNLPVNVAKPDVVAPGNPTNNSSYRSFDIVAQNGKFSPDTIIVKEGDTTNIIVSAIDKDYDFTQPDYGFRVAIKKGEAKKIQFGATAQGKFLFYCNSCGGPSVGPRGYIIVAPK